MIRALLFWSVVVLLFLFIAFQHISNSNCQQTLQPEECVEPVLAKSLTHQHASARRSVIEKETVGRVPCHQLACYERNTNVFVSRSMISFLQAIENIFQQGWVCTASVSWDLGLGKSHTFWCISTLFLLIPYQMKAVGVRHACWPLTFTVKKKKKQHLNKRQVSLSLELHCKQLWRTPTWPLRSPVAFSSDPSSSLPQRAWCHGKMAANVISIMQRINAGPSPDPSTHQREPSRYRGWCSVWGTTPRSAAMASWRAHSTWSNVERMPVLG